MYRSILMTGATGFVGRHLARAVRQQFPEAALALVSRDASSRLPDWQTHGADLRDAPAVERVVAAVKPDLVLHLGAVASVAAAQLGPQTARSVIVDGSRVLAAAVAGCAPGALVLHTSSGEVYGRAALAGPLSEAVEPEPANAYGEAKLAAENVLREGLPPTARLINVRAFNHSGPGQTEDYVLPSWAAQIARIEAGLAPPRLAVGNLSARRDFLHVQDVVRAYVGLLCAAPRLEPHSIFNVASGEAYALTDVIERLKQASGRDVEIVIDPARLRSVDIPIVLGDSSRLRQTTGWRPEKTLDDLLADLLAHWRQVIASR